MRAQYILGVTISPHITRADLYGRGYTCGGLGGEGGGDDGRCDEYSDLAQGNEIGRVYSAGKADHWKGNGNPAFSLHHITGESLSYFYLRNAVSKMVLGTGEIM